MNPDWTQFERTHFTIPGNWVSPGGQPRWKRIVGVDAQGKESDVRPGTKLKIAAAELEFPGGQWNLAFQFQPPQQVTFDGTGMKFSMGSLNGDNWHFGFVRPGQLDVWRGKEKQSAHSTSFNRVPHIRLGPNKNGRSIQTAIDKAAEAGGGTVHLSAARYPVRASLHLRDNVRLVGDPGKTVLAMQPAKPGVRLAKDGKRFVRNITLAEPSGYEVGDGVLISDSKNANGFMVTTATLAEDLGGVTFGLDTYLRFDYDVNHDATIRSDPTAADRTDAHRPRATFAETSSTFLASVTSRQFGGRYGSRTHFGRTNPALMPIGARSRLPGHLAPASCMPIETRITRIGSHCRRIALVTPSQRRIGDRRLIDIIVLW